MPSPRVWVVVGVRVRGKVRVGVEVTFFVLFRSDMCKLTNCSHKRHSIRLDTKSSTALKVCPTRVFPQ